MGPSPTWGPPDPPLCPLCSSLGGSGCWEEPEWATRSHLSDACPAFLGIRYLVVGTSLAVQWLKLCASNTGVVGSIPGCGSKILHATWFSQKRTSLKQTIWCLESLIQDVYIPKITENRYSKKNLYTHIHSNQKVEITQISTHR